MLEMEIVSTCSNFDKAIFLTGDLNARTENLDDFIFVVNWLTHLNSTVKLSFT